MKTSKSVFAAVVVAVLAAVYMPVAAVAAEGAPVVLGVVDLNQVLNAFVAAKNLEKQLEDKRKEFEKQIASEENSLRKAEKEIQGKKDDMSKEELVKESKAFQKKLMDAQKEVISRKRMLDRAFALSMDQLRLETKKVVSGIAHEKKLSAVLTQDSVILSLPEMDITDEVIKKLNSSVKSIPVDWNAAKKTPG